jgi:endonuclease-3 related protein
MGQGAHVGSSHDAKHLLEVYARLHAAYGGDVWHWSPEHTRGAMDIIAGAILVQHTAWTNAERALDALRDAGALDPATLASMPADVLMPLIRVSGTPTIKARRLRAIASTIVEAGGLDALFALPAVELRARLLATHGVGPETADAIMLYGAGTPVFIIDAYTQRLFRRVGSGPKAERYADWQHYFEEPLPADAELFQRYHAVIVLHGKACCRAKPLCAGCPLLDLCPTGQASLGA